MSRIKECKTLNAGYIKALNSNQNCGNFVVRNSVMLNIKLYALCLLWQQKVWKTKLHIYDIKTTEINK